MDDPSSTTLVAMITSSVFLAAMLAATRMGLQSLGASHLEALGERDTADGRAAQRVVTDPEGTRTRLFVGRALFLGVAAACTAVLFHPYGDWWSLLTGAASGLVYALVAEISGGVVSQRAEKLSLKSMRLLRPALTIIGVIAWPIGWAGRAIRAAVPSATPDATLAARAVEHVIEQGAEAGQIAESQAQLLLSVLEFRDTIAREVMVPRTRLIGIERSTGLDVVLQRIEDSGHSRYPVYRESIDHIEGVLYAKDVFRLLRTHDASSDASIASIVRPVFFTPEEKKISELLREMQTKRFHLAVVVDEFGGVSGIVTLEDIVEEIVGEIEDEHDDDSPRIESLGDGRWTLDASLSISDVEEELDVLLNVESDKEGDYDSIGGLVTHLAGEVPVVGSVVRAPGFEITVLGADDRHVSRIELRVERPDDSDNSA